MTERDYPQDDKIQAFRSSKFFMQMQRNISLSQYTSFKIGGAAQYFCLAKTAPEIISAIQWAKNQGLPFFILGGGSNLLVNDKGVRGVVIKVQSSKFKVQSSNSKSKTIEAGSGVLLAQLIQLSLKQGLSGLEWAAGIPRATVGGAIFGSAGAFGKKISAIVREVEVYNTAKNRVEVIPIEKCRFAYKESIFKRNKNLVILNVVLSLNTKSPKQVQEEIKRVLQYRKDHHPTEPSAGSVFLNVENNPKNKKTLSLIPGFEIFSDKKEIPAGWLIEKAGLCGKIIGGAQISTKHCNFIINSDKAKTNDVLALIKTAKQTVRKKFGVALQEEVQCF